MENLKLIRKQKGYKQSDVAEALKMTRSSYSKYERGERNPDPQTLKKISEFLDVSIDYLLGNTSVPLTLTEIQFLNDKEKMTDNELIDKYDLVVDGKKVSIEEIRKMLRIIRALDEEK